ncbi:LOW QUALITY PROTEIN: hypothetical protein HID58_071974, partial [Brassica napus]
LDFINGGSYIHSFIIKYSLVIDLSVCNSYLQCTATSLICTVILETKQILFLGMLFRRHVCDMNNQQRCNLLLRACVKILSLKLENQVHCYNLKIGLVLKRIMTKRLIDMYVKFGSLEKTKRIFYSMYNKNIVLWSTFWICTVWIWRRSSHIIKEMKSSGWSQNHVTFVGVLTACSHVG